jgi:hypothetical protein
MHACVAKVACALMRCPVFQNSGGNGTVSLREELLAQLNVSTQCSPGYGGTACSLCTTGFYRLEEKCEPCPKTAYLIIVAYAVGIGTPPASYALEGGAAGLLSACTP